MYHSPAEEKKDIPTVVPMRRGRPTVQPQAQKQGSRSPAPKVTNGDPFAALDSKAGRRLVEEDEIASRFPTLDQFTLFHEKGSKFDFDTSASSPSSQDHVRNKRLTERLADEAKFDDPVNQLDATSSHGSGIANRADSPSRFVGPPNPAAAINREPAADQSVNALDDMNEDGSKPEIRRELERRKLEEEEKRVTAAQAEYRNCVSSSGRPVPGPKNVGGPPRTASTIQSRMQSLLNEEHRPVSIQRTAQGYGKYTDAPSECTNQKPPAATKRKSVGAKPIAGAPSKAVNAINSNKSHVSKMAMLAPSTSPKPAGSKPPAPKKKPTHLNSFPTTGHAESPVKQVLTAQSEQLIAIDLAGQPILEMSAKDKEDYIQDFTKRFPSLSSIELESQQGRGGGSR
ncbi:hypothetical protein UVI_02037430 [Ustilaginoidea virens]|uniref:Uncharacterized protein n=1 Tax=Ustilaginoidea virens TaxID=1159556 RepID=A0A1B5KW41_USTVR|nr:hypothetical protein UVI_02037430 [Ustilaginoidea virens]